MNTALMPRGCYENDSSSFRHQKKNKKQMIEMKTVLIVTGFLSCVVKSADREVTQAVAFTSGPSDQLFPPKQQ